MLPIAAILPALLEATANPRRNLVVEAPPGAGKTTGIPVALLEAKRAPPAIWVLQPRRLAARLAAMRCAQLLGEPVGERVGYQIRFERRSGRNTQLLFVTEGILLRRLREDPELNGIGTVILDEFHERHLEGDVALALLRRLQLQRRAPLRLIAMSATLDAEPVASFLAAERLRAEGRSFPVEIDYRSPRSRHGPRPLERRVAAAVAELVEHGLSTPAGPGHLLVFLPGLAEIRACAASCEAVAARAGLELHALHGALPREQQDRAVQPSPQPKLILATNVAETSITIDGVVAVIDSGLARVADFDPGSRLPRLSVAAISRASAAQRAGRAGRTAPGRCLRLYSRGDHDRRPAHDLPEIRRLDLAAPLLELAAAAVEDVERFPWFEAPTEAALRSARELLVALGALDAGTFALTDTGRAMLRFPVHPRLARLLVEGAARGIPDLAAQAAAVLSDAPLRRSRPRAPTDADVLEDIQELGTRQGDPQLRLLRRGADQLAKQARALPRGPRPAGVEARELALRQALLAAHPDRVAQLHRRGESDRATLVFADGGSAELAASSGVGSHRWLVALRSQERRSGAHSAGARVDCAAAIEPDWLLDLFPEQIIDEEQLRFDDQLGRVTGESTLRYGKLVLASSPLSRLPPVAASAVLLEAARSAGPARFCQGRGDPLGQLRLRAAFIHGHRPDFPALDEAGIDACLAALCEGRSSFAELEAANLLTTLETQLGLAAGDPRALERLAPRELTLAGGRRLTINYEPDRPPWVGSWLQDFFGLSQGPSLLGGEVPVVLHLRAPNRHDVAVTTDLAGFWREHYPALRRQLGRRYPKHAWPEDPLRAQPPRPGGRRRR